MRLAIVNDCAYAGQTILTYLLKSIDTTYIKRVRVLTRPSELHKIRRAKADAYNVHRLLQEYFIASIFTKRTSVRSLGAEPNSSEKQT